MSLLRVRGSLTDAALRCQWALVDDGRVTTAGEGTPAELPLRAGRTYRCQLVIPAAQVLLARAHLPHGARRQAGNVLAFAVEEQTAGEPDANQVSWLGAAAGGDMLAVVDKAGLMRWRDALAASGVKSCEVHSEALLLPRMEGEWSVAWDGREGFVRNGRFEGAATDCGSGVAPPLSLRLMLEEAGAAGALPAAIALYTTAPDAAPDVAAWTRTLGVAVRLAGDWDWRLAAPEAGIALAQDRRPWRAFAGATARLRPAAWILGAALAVQGIALAVDWSMLAREQQALRLRMETRFRSVFPDTIAVVDPALQMRRKLAEARHAAGQPDPGDFLPMIEQVAAAAQELPAGALRAVSFESGRLTLEFSAVDEASLRRVASRLTQQGLSAELGGTKVMTVRTL